nr:retrovirus-related Pol polyprotein from transposon TNT 1-94 [Tanacetum cinerariifolium]
MRPFGCLITILNTKDHVGKFDGKADEGFFVGYSLNRVFNNITRIMEENLHIRFSENTPNIAGSELKWLFDIDAITKLMNYKPVVARNQSNDNAGTKACDDAGKSRMETIHGKDYILLPLWIAYLLTSQESKSSQDDGFQPSSDDGKKVDEDPRHESECKDQEKEDNVNITNNVNVVGTNRVNAVGANTNNKLPFDPKMHALEDINTFNFSSDHKDNDEEADMNNMDTTIQFSPTPTTRIHKDHPFDQVIKDLHSTTQTRNMFKNLEEHGFVTTIHQRTTIKTYKTVCLLVFYHKKNPKRIKVIRLFLVYAYFKDFVVYQMDAKSAFLYEKIKEEVYVCQSLGFEDPDFPSKVYKVEKALYGLHQALRAWHKDDIFLVQVYVDDIIFGSAKKILCNEFKKMMHEKFHMSFMGELIFFLGLQVKQKQDRIFISQDRYVVEILKKYVFPEVKNASTPMETQKPLLKDEDGEEVDVHMYRTLIGSLMYLTSSRLDIMFVVCACARYQVNPKVSHLRAMKRIFSARHKLWLQIPQHKLNMWLLQVAVDKYNGFKINCLILVDGKKIPITESTVKRDLQLEDAEGVDCLPNAIIFDQLTLMGTMASAIICLATNQKFNFSKYIFESMVKKLDNVNKFLMYLRKPRRKVTKVPQPSNPTSVVDEAVNEEMNDSLEKAATTTSFDAEQDKGNIFKTQSKATPKKPGSQGTSLGGGPRVLDLETTKTTQALKIDSLKRRVKKLERRKRSRNPGLKRLYKVRLSARVKSYKDEGLDGDEVIVEDVEMLFDVADDLRGKEVFVSQEVPLKESAKPKTTSASIRPKAKGLVIHKQEQAPTPTVSLQQSSHVNDKGKGKMVEPEPVKKLSKKDQLMLDEELAFKIQAEEEKNKGLPEKKLNKLKKLQAEEQDELTDAEMTKLFMQFLEKRRKFFATKRDKEKRDRPPTRAQQRRDELEQERSKKQKAEDDKESEELKKCLEIIPDDRDDVTIDVTPLSSNKILKNFDREDLEVLWRLVKARFEKNILYYLLVEKMYPLTNHKLHQMFNDVKLQVDYECEMAFERLRLVMK